MEDGPARIRYYENGDIQESRYMVRFINFFFFMRKN